MQEKKISRREREKLRQRQDMLTGALELFSQKGYHNVSMHEIAKKSEFAIGTLYKFFKNKEDLYRSLVFEQSDRFYETIMRAMEGGDEVEKLQAFVRAKRDFFMANVSMIRLYFAQTRGAHFNIMTGLDTELRKQYEILLQKLATIFESGIQKNRFKKISDPYHLAVSLESITNAFFSLYLESPERHPFPRNPDDILDILLKGIVSP